MAQIKANYRMVVNRGVKVPMRDGLILAMDVYRPTLGIGTSSGRSPVVLLRTAFGKSHEGNSRAAERLCRRGCVAVVQDRRGAFSSGGDSQAANEAEDESDTVEWLSTQGWSDGRVVTASLDGVLTDAPGSWPADRLDHVLEEFVDDLSSRC